MMSSFFDGGSGRWSEETVEKGKKFIEENEYTFTVLFILTGRCLHLYDKIHTNHFYRQRGLYRSRSGRYDR